MWAQVACDALRSGRVLQLQYDGYVRAVEVHAVGVTKDDNSIMRVWQTLLKIPMGRAVSYSDIAHNIENPKASRAVGAAIGRNPVSFVVPCHRALGKDGKLTGYHWGITRKQAMLGWEAGQVGLH